jgi:hypothetical protein
METCPKCNAVIKIGDFPFCPHTAGTNNVLGDDPYIGGVVLEHLGDKPITVYSRAERAAAIKASGHYEFVRHVPLQGSDKSPHTVDWSKGSMDPQTLKNAAELVARAKTVKANPETPPTIHAIFTIREL